MDANNMEFPERHFDCIYALESIFHLQDREQFISDIKKILKPKATFGFTDFVPIFPFNHIFSYIEKRLCLAKRTYGTVDFNISMQKYYKIFKKN